SEVSPRSCSDVRRKVRLHLLTVLASLGLLSFAEDVGPESEIQEEEYEEKEEEKEEEENAALRRHAAPRTRGVAGFYSSGGDGFGGHRGSPRYRMSASSSGHEGRCQDQCSSDLRRGVRTLYALTP
ncbi:unnamed protein product, partial [Prorocentrum cordatum]